MTLTVIHGPAGLDVAARGGKALDAELFQSLAALCDQSDLARLDWDGQPITRRVPALPMGRAQVVPPPGAFLQATAEGEAALLAAVREITSGASMIADLFAGCGWHRSPRSTRSRGWARRWPRWMPDGATRRGCTVSPPRFAILPATPCWPTKLPDLTQS